MITSCCRYDTQASVQGGGGGEEEEGRETGQEGRKYVRRSIRLKRTWDFSRIIVFYVTMSDVMQRI